MTGTAELVRGERDAILHVARMHGATRVRVFGSVARGERWPRGMPIRSDLDLLVLVSEPLEPALEQELIDATYPLFLESGRVIGPQFRTPEQHAASPSRVSIDRDAIEVPL